MRLTLVIAAVLACSPALAAPSADLVLVWAPGRDVAPIEAAARSAGVALLDQSPVARPRATTVATITRAIAEFDALRVDDAARLLEEAKDEIDRTGAADLGPTALSDLFLYRARIASERGDAPGAWDALTTAMIVVPSRVIDPARFAPSVIAEIERARATIATRARATITVAAVPSCRVTIDGVTASRAAYVVGPHWIHVACPGHEPWGTRVELVGQHLVVRAGNAPIAAPRDDELLIQARTVGSRAFVVASIVDDVAWLRLLSSDGRERDWRTVRVGADLAPAAAALTDMLAVERVAPRRWYQSPWLWAGIGAAIATAIVLPIALGGDSTPEGFTAAPTGTEGLWTE